MGLKSSLLHVKNDQNLQSKLKNLKLKSKPQTGQNTVTRDTTLVKFLMKQELTASEQQPKDRAGNAQNKRHKLTYIRTTSH